MPEDIETSMADGTVIGLGGSCAPSSGKPDTLISAGFVPPADVTLTFADGVSVRSAFAILEINPASLLLPTIKAATPGDALEVMCSDGELIRIDSIALRAMVDPVFAAEFERKLNAARGPLSELLEAAPNHEPPQEWWVAQGHLGACQGASHDTGWPY